jgi:hypothetical protein
MWSPPPRRPHRSTGSIGHSVGLCAYAGCNAGSSRCFLVVPVDHAITGVAAAVDVDVDLPQPQPFFLIHTCDSRFPVKASPYMTRSQPIRNKSDLTSCDVLQLNSGMSQRLIAMQKSLVRSPSLTYVLERVSNAKSKMRLT